MGNNPTPPPLGKGRPPGTPNKSTAAAREAIARLVDGNVERMQEWLDIIAEKEGALVAFNCMRDVLEYHVPKLQRAVIAGDPNAPLQVVRWQTPDEAGK